LLTALEEVPAIDEEIQRVFLGELDALSDYVVEMVGCQVVRDEIPKERR
jgi:hypothetical protein